MNRFMDSLRGVSMLRRFVVLIASALTLASCGEVGPTSNDDAALGLKPGAPPPPNASPAIVFKGSTTVKKTLYPTISVVDADGSDQSVVYQGGVSALFRRPTWAATGSGTASSPWSVSFTESGGGSSGKLQKVDVWVEAGVVKSSAVSTLAEATSGSSILYFQAYSPSTTTPEIAYVVTQTDPAIDAADRTSTLYVIPAAGGTPTEIFSVTGSTLKGIAWSPDATQLAVSDLGSIWIVDRDRPTSGTTPYMILTDDEHYSVVYLDWSRANTAGFDHLVYDASASAGASPKLYTVDLNAATPTPQPLNGPNGQITGATGTVTGTWSPDNGRIAYTAGARVVLATGQIETNAAVGTFPDWKR